MVGSKLSQAIADYERQRERVEGWSAFIHAVERVAPEYYAALLKRWPKRGRRAT